ELAPDARTLACLEPSTDLTLFDVATGAQIFQKKSFFKPNFIDVLMLQLRSVLSGGQTGGGEFNFELIGMSFSPDGRYFAAGDRSVNFNGIGVSAETSAVAIDVSAPKGSLPLRDPLKRLLAGKFAFVGADRVVGVDPQDYRKSALVSFPAGEIVEQFPLNGRVEAATRGNYIVLRPIQGFAAGVMDLATKKILFANKLAAIDVYDQFFVSERSNGEVGLYRVDKTERVGVVVLPRNPLGILRARAVSPDFKWLAVSERSRGAVWDLAKGARVMHVRGFRGAHFGGDGLFYADFPKFEAMERTIAWVNLSTGGAVDGMKFGLKKDFFWKICAPVATSKSVRSVLGSRHASVRASGASSTSSRVAKEEAKTDPRLGSRLAAMKEKEGDYFLQVLDARTGIQLGRLLVETGKGSFHIRDVEAAGDWVIVSDSENRVLAYSVSTGEQRGRFFGDGEAISKASGLLAVENERGQLTLYDLATAQKRDEFNFPAAVSFARFSDDGKRLFVLTANQTAYVINVAGDR
ncbi:MAG: PQQ-like beta-propeller repeat protein, partial [Acidobacteria bacterium]|nr:PQQ-like beta-propeller repeat protein [Acidobacteriota bacterium]